MSAADTVAAMAVAIAQLAAMLRRFIMPPAYLTRVTKSAASTVRRVNLGRFAHYHPAPMRGGVMNCWRILYRWGFVRHAIVPRLRSVSESTTSELSELSPDWRPAKSLTDGRRRDGWIGTLPRSKLSYRPSCKLRLAPLPFALPCERSVLNG